MWEVEAMAARTAPADAESTKSTGSPRSDQFARTKPKANDRQAPSFGEERLASQAGAKTCVATTLPASVVIASTAPL